MTNNVLNWRYDRLGSRASICGANDGWGGGAINWKFAEKMYQNDGDGPRRKATFLTPDEFLYDSKLCGWETDFDADGNEMSLADKKKIQNVVSRVQKACSHMAYIWKSRI